MPVCSYLVYPSEGKSESVMTSLNAMNPCVAARAKDGDMLILVTDTVNKDEEESLQQALSGVDDIQCLVLTFGSVDESIGEEN